MFRSRFIPTTDADRTGNSAPKRLSAQAYLPLEAWRTAIDDMSLIELRERCTGPLVEPEHEIEFLVTAVLREWDDARFIKGHLRTMTTSITASTVPRYFRMKYPGTMGQGTPTTGYRVSLVEIGRFYSLAPRSYWISILGRSGHDSEDGEPESIFPSIDIDALFDARRGNMFGVHPGIVRYIMNGISRDDLHQLLDTVCYGRWSGGNCASIFLHFLVSACSAREIIRLEHVIGAGRTPIGAYLRRYILAFKGRRAYIGILPEFADPADLGCHLFIHGRDRIHAVLRAMSEGLLCHSDNHVPEGLCIVQYVRQLYFDCLRALKNMHSTANADVLRAIGYSEEKFSMVLEEYTAQIFNSILEEPTLADVLAA